MSDDATLLETLAALAAARVPLVLVTVVDVAGSVPRKPGAKMLVTQDAQHGTIGGGAIEHTVVEKAREVLRAGGGPELMRRHLTRDLAMCCGGAMTLFVDPVLPSARLVVFGAGHVAQPLARTATLAGFEVTVCDDREDWLTTERFPDARTRVLESPENFARRVAIEPDTAVVVVTPEHSVDEAVLAELLARDPVPGYLGVIGSRRKRARFVERLTARGFPSERIAALRMPVGLAIGADTAGEIAVSIVAELVAWRRGVTAVAPW